MTKMIFNDSMNLPYRLLNAGTRDYIGNQTTSVLTCAIGGCIMY